MMSVSKEMVNITRKLLSEENIQNWEIARDGIETMEEMIDKVRDIL